MISIERSSSNETRGGGRLPGQPRSVVDLLTVLKQATVCCRVCHDGCSETQTAVEVSPCISSVARWLGSIKSSGPANSPSPTFAAPWCASRPVAWAIVCTLRCGRFVGRVRRRRSPPAGPARAAPAPCRHRPASLTTGWTPAAGGTGAWPGWSAGPLSTPATPRVDSAPAAAAPSGGGLQGRCRRSASVASPVGTIGARSAPVARASAPCCRHSRVSAAGGGRPASGQGIRLFDAEQDIHAS